MKVYYSLDSRLRGNDKKWCGNDKKDPACATTWNKAPIWIHGDFAIGNILMDGEKLTLVALPLVILPASL
jgi:aminoglycoside phosphotransferase (APT) family kinase protein